MLKLKALNTHKFAYYGWQSSKRHIREVSHSVTFTAIDKSPSTPIGSQKYNQLGRLKVPLLKSPSHLGHSTSRMNRMYNEDKYSACVFTKEINGKEQVVFNFNIFDGHGGDQCCTFLQQNLSEEIEKSNELCVSNEVQEKLVSKYMKNIGGYWKRWYKFRKDHFKEYRNKDKQIVLEQFPQLQDDWHIRLPLSFLNTDYDFFESDDNKSGSTCTSVFIETVYSEPELKSPVIENYYFNRKSISKITIAQVGDTKAILVDRNGEAHALTDTHHPSSPVEASRLRKYAANFFMTDSFGEERFISLANTRAFGDLSFKQMGITAEPDISQFIIGDANTISNKLTEQEISNYTIGGLGGDEAFLILCTDGITDVITDQEIADIIMVHANLKSANPQHGAEEVIKFVEYVGGDDNATCMVIRLNGWGRWPISDRTGELRQERLDDFSPRSERMS